MSRINSRDLADNAITNDKLSQALLRGSTFLYDFTVGGGAVGAVTLTAADGTAKTLPGGALIVGSIRQTAVVPVSGGSATIALGVTSQTATIEAATAYNDTAYATIGKNKTNLAVAGTAKLTGETSVLATIATATLTAGKFYLTVFWLPSQF